MNTTAVICGILGVIAYFFYYVIGTSTSGNDGQGVNIPEDNLVSNPEPSAADQRGRWD
tara:strand:+ start:157 stop:330 length:174 start_codon:yes stop_codon:yes gene_type:complete